MGNRRTQALLITGLFGILAGCNSGMDGAYQGYTIYDTSNPVSGRIAVPVWLTVSGDKAEMKTQLQALTYPVKINGNQLILSDNRGRQLTLMRREDGKTLDCQQCAQNSLPDMWVLMEK